MSWEAIRNVSPRTCSKTLFFQSCYCQAVAGPQVLKSRWCFCISILLEGHLGHQVLSRFSSVKFYIPHRPTKLSSVRLSIYTYTYIYVCLSIYAYTYIYVCFHVHIVRTLHVFVVFKLLPGLADLTRNYPHDLLLWQLLGAALTDERPVDL